MIGDPRSSEGSLYNKWLVCVVDILTKANIESKIPRQSGKLGGTLGSRPKNGTVPAKTGRMATLHMRQCMVCDAILVELIIEKNRDPNK